MILSSVFVNFPENVKSLSDMAFVLDTGGHGGFLAFCALLIDVDGNDFSIVVAYAYFVDSFGKSLANKWNNPIELLFAERLSGSSSIGGPDTGTRSVFTGDCFCFLLFLSFLCFLCFFLTTSLFANSLLT